VHPVCRDGRVYGRGSCDVKGFLACALEAVGQLDANRLSRPLALVLTADEEVGCIGAKYLASENAFKSRYMIIGEPTGLAPVRAGKGYAVGEIIVRGKEAHSAFPERGRSAIREAAHVVERLDNVARQLSSRTNSDFDPPFTTLNAGLIQGGTAKNIVPGECRITVEWRPVPGQDAAWAGTLIEEELERLSREFPGFDAELKVTRLDPAFSPTQTSDLASLFESLTRHSSTTVPFGTEAAHLASLTSEAIVFGPGDMTVAHKTGEFVPIEELRLCVTYLVAAIEELCSVPSN
jgi:acetylornithine deacetylase